ncbi:hypothetical protein ACU4GI_12980 [Cupriavidus basilensis]
MAPTTKWLAVQIPTELIKEALESVDEAPSPSLQSAINHFRIGKDTIFDGEKTSSTR